jgi:hypothetical protein
MSHIHPKQYFADAHRAVAYGGGIDWEELPSLAQHLIARRTRRSADGTEADAADTGSGYESAWLDTRPSPLEATDAAPPFRETLEGLETREVTAPDLFRHFFGNTRQR